MKTKKIGSTEFNVDQVKKMGKTAFCKAYKNILHDPESAYSELTGKHSKK